MKGSKMDDEEMEKGERQLMRKRKRTAGIVVVGESRAMLDHLPDELQSDILTRLPAKNLHQCMCVSKAWCSIVRDPPFLRAYLRQQPHGSLLVSITDARDYKGDMWFPENPIGLAVYYSPLLRVQDQGRNQVQCPQPFLSLVKIPSFDLFKGVTKVVNGLVCAYGSIGAMVCSVGTREIVWLPEISGFRNSAYEDYYFGYHPGNEVYKLLKISKSNSKQEAHILTLGRDSSWRKLAIGLDGSSERLPADSFLCNGVLYWVMHGLVERLGLISFDLKTEKFQFIEPPKHPIFSSRQSWWIPTKFRGRLALLVYGFWKNAEAECFSIYTLENCDDRGSSSWDRHAIPTPPEFRGAGRFCAQLVGNLPTGQILLTDMHIWKHCDDFIPIYSYDDQRNEFEKFIVGSIPQETIRALGFTFRLSYMAQENVVSLAVLFRKWVKSKVNASTS
ncbi:F-box only protein 8-like [Coffea arabica]|uniref:F-box only protein 8-like n=1 Tax=Coffea arabica TaxID=13443 RepID=A0A6P6W991_COFAR|nr:F-box only protein 8-like [Coffea arabica]